MLQEHLNGKRLPLRGHFCRIKWTWSTCAAIWYSGSVISVCFSILMKDILCQDSSDCRQFHIYFWNFYNVYEYNIKKAQCDFLFDNASLVISTHQNELNSFNIPFCKKKKLFKVFQRPFETAQNYSQVKTLFII